jgi:hypothetical protein
MRLAVDPETNARLSKAARKAWELNYSPDVVRAQYDEIFGLTNEASAAFARRTDAGVREQGW